ncbi:MAG: hypothetical protein LIO77_04705 [Rikenellaceae bacterium]|nr:hypothetical protein [Rikenellaceae bacterium]
MEERKNNGPVCDQCQQDFKEEIKELVDNVENHSQREYEEKKEEIESAFGSEGNRY